jgi:phosphoribosylformimino-5-aminoimidazole carboxamide ribonucleotide (ProFAR) isomerase
MNLASLRIIFTVTLLFFLSGCFATMTEQGPPPAKKYTGKAPTAAMLPIKNTNDAGVSRYVTDYLQNCLQERNIFSFVSKDKVDQAVSQSGFDMTKTFGLNDSEYKELALQLGVDYVIHGIISVRKSLKFTGWRKDVDVYITLHDGSTGAKTDSWRSLTDFTWTDADTESDARKMGESAANHICSKMMQ